MKASTLLLAAAALGAGCSEPVFPPLNSIVSKTADSEHGAVHYKVAGSGEPAIVFVHGWASDMRVFREQVAAFAPDHRCLFVDLIGHGRSARPAIDYSMDQLAGSIRAAMDAEGVEQAVLVGHSNGTPVVRQFYRRHPGRTVALVAVDGALQSVIPEPVKNAFLRMMEGEGWKGGLIERLVGNVPERIRDDIVAMMSAVPEPVMVATFLAATAPDIWADDPIEVPLLAVIAPSPQWTDEYEAAVRAIAPRLDYRRIDGTGHFLMMEKPEEFHSMVQEFLRKL